MKKILMICLTTCTIRQKILIVLIDHKNKSHRLNYLQLQGNVYADLFYREPHNVTVLFDYMVNGL